MKEIKLTNTYLVALVDDEHFERLSKFEWRLDNQGYVTTGQKKHMVMMHQLLHTPDAGCITDHKDRCKLNNQMYNLRNATKAQNATNSKHYKSSTTGYRGVSLYARTGKFIAGIKVNKVRVHLGFFDSAVEAAKAYNEAAIKHHGEFATLNNI